MKIIGNDGKEYSSVEECQEAEAKLDSQKETVSKDELSKTEKTKADPILSEEKQLKKELANKIREAEKNISSAEENLKEAKIEANKIVAEAQREAEEKLKEAYKVLDKAREERMLAIKEFTDKFGSYTKIYTGTDAVEEYFRVIKDMNRFFDKFWF